MRSACVDAVASSPPSVSEASPNELSTAAGYYTLYRNIDSAKRAASVKQSRALTPVPVDSEREGTTSGNFWVEDEWTEDDTRQAESTLSQNLSQCDLKTSSIRGSYLIQRLESDAGANWDRFYERHGTSFFKDRHYLAKAFPDEFGSILGHSNGEDGKELTRGSSESEKLGGGDAAEDGVDQDDYTVVEIGCGVGNAILPLLEHKNLPQHRRHIVWGLDFSAVAIDLMKSDSRFVSAGAEGRAHAAVWDITGSGPPSGCEGVADVSMLLFCLSAVSPNKMDSAAQNVAATLKPGGTLILRDYGRYDEAMMKLGQSRGKRLGDNFYVKSDGTRCYYFDLDDMRRLFAVGAGLDILELRYVRRVYVNRGSGTKRRRVWVQGRFRKPLLGCVENSER